MSTQSSSSSSGIGFIGLLTLLFVGLKLTGHIAWSWFWVLSPLIFTTGVLLIGVLGILAVFLRPESKRKRRS
jgi:hypothetical protein